MVDFTHGTYSSNAVRGDDSIRPHTKQNLLRTFVILYYTGLRLNEVQSLRLKHIEDLITSGETVIDIAKTKNQRKLFASKSFIKELKALFMVTSSASNDLVISKGSNASSSLSPIVYITQVNKYIQSVLGEGYSSHSFRQGIITELASKSVNVKTIAAFINHSDVKTTLRYIKPTDSMIKDCLVR